MARSPNVRMVFWAILAASVPCTLVGCGKPYSVAPVSGKVTLDGRPLAAAQVVFQPVGSERVVGPGSYGTTDADGNFSLSLVAGGNGAVVGAHRVSIVVPAPGGEQQDVSPESGSAEKSWTDLGFEVPSGGSDSANFDLKTPPKAP